MGINMTQEEREFLKNTQITEDYVSFEVAKLLKEKEFNETVRCFYNIRTERLCDDCVRTKNSYTENIAAPTLQMAMKWLREVHNKNIIIDMVPLDEDCYVLWTFNIYCNKNYKIMWGTKQPKYNTYEEACEAAIKYCLENLVINT